MQIISIFKHTLMVTFFVFVMMLLVDFVDIVTRRRISIIIKGGELRQYLLASFFGSTPGCLGAFMNVSLYIHGMISFGALVGGMVATSGDEAFVMLSQFPVTALFLFVILFMFGVLFAWMSDRVIPRLRITPLEYCVNDLCEECLGDEKGQERYSGTFGSSNLVKNFQYLSFARFLLLLILVSILILISLGSLGPPVWNWTRITFMSLSMCSIYIAMGCSDHYLDSHIWRHIVKNHLFKIFLWSFGALMLVHRGLDLWNLNAIIDEKPLWILFMSAFLGIIPESGPHLVFVMMYGQSLIPFSVLLTSSIVQEGHAMLPLLSFSVRDASLIKFIKVVSGLFAGCAFFLSGY